MIAVDTNILVYAHREDSQFHKKADESLSRLAEDEEAWAIPYPCLHEFLAIVTHNRIYKPPTPVEDALLQVECWLECPTLQLLGEGVGYWAKLKSAVRNGKISGALVHDARIAALCVQHGVDVLWSADRDYSRFRNLSVENPLI